MEGWVKLAIEIRMHKPHLRPNIIINGFQWHSTHSVHTTDSRIQSAEKRLTSCVLHSKHLLSPVGTGVCTYLQTGQLHATNTNTSTCYHQSAPVSARIYRLDSYAPQTQAHREWGVVGLSTDYRNISIIMWTIFVSKWWSEVGVCIIHV